MSKTHKLKMNYAYHLYTEIKGIMKKDSPILNIINTLYPTPALSGYPKNKAIKKIFNLFDNFLLQCLNKVQ